MVFAFGCAGERALSSREFDPGPSLPLAEMSGVEVLILRVRAALGEDNV